MNSASASSADPARRFDMVIVGGGLAGGLIAAAASDRRPGRVAIIDKDERFGGNHTWSFHAGDVPAEAASFVDPLVSQRWSGYDVAFPGRQRTIDRPYATITSDGFDRALKERLAGAGAALLLGRTVTHVDAHVVALDSGETVHADLVIDARGPRPVVGAAGDGGAGYQKFVGLELELGRDSGITRPLLMDATVAQSDGYRFVYVLPFSPTRLLVEDTIYSDSPALDRRQLRQRVLGYVASRGLSVRAIVREETGVLPLPWLAGTPPSTASPILAGYGGGWFHPVTGYSVPVAVRFALAVREAGDPAAVAGALKALWRRHEVQARYGRWLNRMLFTMVEPAARWELFARFYRLPTATIERFYSLQTTPVDRLRIVCGRPPRGTSLRKVLRPFIKEDA